MVDQQDSDSVGVGQPLQCGEVPVVVGVGVIVSSPSNHLQGINDDERRVRVPSKELLQLFRQTVAQDAALGAEVDVGRRVLRHIEQPILDAELGVFQAKLESRTLLHPHPPDGFTLGNRDRQPQGQPRLPHLGRTSKNMESLRNRRVHYKVQRLERLTQQSRTVNRIQICHEYHSLLLNEGADQYVDF